MSTVKNQRGKKNGCDDRRSHRALHDASDGFGQLCFENRFRLFKLEVHLVGVGYHAGLIFSTVALLRAGLQLNAGRSLS